jgi:hypothetical protein
MAKASNVGAANPAQEQARRRFSTEVLEIDAEISFDEFDRVYTENPELIYTKVHQLVTGITMELATAEGQVQTLEENVRAKDAQIEELIQDRDQYVNAVAQMTIEMRSRPMAREATPGGTDSRKSTKLADPEHLEGKDTGPTFEQWLSRMKSKLKANADHFPTAELQMAYIEGRVKGDAARAIQARMKPDHPEAYQTAQEMFDHLAEVYEDHNKVAKDKDKFRKLMMRNGDDFQTFRTEFLHLAGETKLAKNDWNDEFFRKLSFQMQPLVATKKNGTFKELEKACFDVAPTLGKAYGIPNPKKAAGPEKKFGAPGAAAPPANAPFNPRAGQEDRAKLLAEGKCFYCKEAGHMKQQCPKYLAAVERRKAVASTGISELAALEAGTAPESEASKNE